MKKLAIFTVLILSACTQVIASNEKQITIKAAPIVAGQAFQQADQHCQQFGKIAVPSGQMYMNTTVFRCE